MSRISFALGNKRSKGSSKIFLVLASASRILRFFAISASERPHFDDGRSLSSFVRF